MISFKHLSGGAASAALLVALNAPGIVCAQEATQAYNIPSQPIAAALREFARVSGEQIVFDEARLRGRNGNAVQGRLTSQEAINRLLAGTGLSYRQTGAGVFAVTVDSQATASPDVVQLSEIIVQGRPSLNIDLPRSEDGPQPYVIFSAEEIRNSQALTAGDFIRERLPQSSANPSIRTTSATVGSGFFLRGFTNNDVLILVDGRPAPQARGQFGTSQADINGIPLSAIERIEVLPASSAGMYGGSATGGVINIILRRDYTGSEVGVTYSNAFETDIGRINYQVSAGHRFDEGRTSIMLTAQHAEGNDATQGDLGAVERFRGLLQARAPSLLFAATRPPVSTTPNIRSSTGVNLTLDNGQALGSTITHVPLGYRVGDSLQGFVANAGRYNLALPNDRSAAGALRSVGTPAERNSVGLNIRREVTGWLDIYADARYDVSEGRVAYNGFPTDVTLAANHPANPFQQSIRVSYSNPGADAYNSDRSENYTAIVGAIVQLPSQWRAALDYSWDRGVNEQRQSPTSAAPAWAAAIGAAGTINILQDPAAAPRDYSPYLFAAGANHVRFSTQTEGLTLRIGGPVAQLFGNEVTFSGGGEYREQTIDPYRWTQVDTSRPPTTSFALYGFGGSRTSAAVFGNINVPLISESNRQWWADGLEINLTARHDRYDMRTAPADTVTLPTADAPAPTTVFSESEFSSTDYAVTALYRPISDISFRASYATGFKAPEIGQLTQDIQQFPIGSLFVQDSKRGFQEVGTDAAYTLIADGNPNLKPETSEAVSFGVIFQPRILPGLRLSVDYVSVDKADEVAGLPAETFVDREAELEGRVVRENRALTPAEIAAGFTATPITLINTSYVNLASTRTRSVDIQLDYEWTVDSLGDFHASVIASRQFERSIALFPSDPKVNWVGTLDGPDNWNGNARLSWRRGSMVTEWFSKYYDSYYPGYPDTAATVIADRRLANGRTRMPSQWRHDLTTSIDLGEQLGGVWEGTQLRAAIKNVFDTQPDIFIQDAAVFSYSKGYDPYGRSYQLSLVKRF